jgi:TolB-like protein/Tfp pilus assembly protein PilF
VLPFENRSAKQDDAYFVDGIHDDILTQLTKIGAMKVIARTSVEQFRDTKLTTKEIGEKLGVTRVLEGGVQRAGDRVRVTVQLIDTATDGHLWAENYDRELTAANIFAIQSEVAAAIAGALNATLNASEAARVNAVPTRNFEAWEAYQLGRQRMAKRTSGAVAEAETFFRKAIELDPGFALAYSGLADTLDLQVTYSGAPRDATWARAQQAADKALELDPNLAEAWVSSGIIAADKSQYERAEKAYRRAIQLNPNYASAYHWLSELQSWRGHLEEALFLSERAADLDPLSAAVNARLANRLMAMGRFDEADARLRRSIDIDPSIPGPYRSLAWLRAYAFNRFADGVLFATKAAELDPDTPMNSCTLTPLKRDLDDDAQAAGLIQTARQRWPDSQCVAFHWAFLEVFRGRQNSVLQAADELLAFDPTDWDALVLMRNSDLQSGHPESARARYAKAYPGLISSAPPTVDRSNYQAAIDLALVMQMTGESGRATLLLERSEQALHQLPRRSAYGIADAQIHALRGDKAKALAALREAERAGWRGPYWRYYRDFDSNLASIRNEPEFKAVFADIERDMARQRAELAKRPKDAPLDFQ